jgi:predicted metal-dependent hydrolase
LSVSPEADTLAAVQRGAELFDRGEYFEAHEVWEERWRQSEDEAERLGLQGLIQVTAAFHKWFVVKSPESAQRLLARGTQKLEATARLPGVALGELLPVLRACAAAMATAELTREHVPALSRV